MSDTTIKLICGGGASCKGCAVDDGVLEFTAGTVLNGAAAAGTVGRRKSSNRAAKFQIRTIQHS